MRVADACTIALCGAALAAACAVPRPSSTADEMPRIEDVAGPGLLFDVRYLRDDGDDVTRIAARLLAAGPHLSRWGAFRHRVSIRILPDHAALEKRIGLHGYPWLRAWAFGDQVLLQSPRSLIDTAADTDEPAEPLGRVVAHGLLYQVGPPRAGGVP